MFPLAYRWNASAVNSVDDAQLASINQLLAAASTDSIVLPSDLIPSSATLRFFLTVTNRMGGVSVPASATMTKATSPTLTVGFVGGVL